MAAIAGFNNLDPSNPLRLTWKTRVERILSVNNQASELITKYRSRITVTEFGQECDAFKKHADEWADVWKAAMGPDPVPDELRGRNKLAPTFPPGLEDALEKEITEVKRLAGI